MKATIAYFVDGPLHDSHAELERPVHEWHVVRPNLGDRHFAAPDARDPHLYVTLETGTYRRSERPAAFSTRVEVWRYAWQGWCS